MCSAVCVARHDDSNATPVPTVLLSCLAAHTAGKAGMPSTSKALRIQAPKEEVRVYLVSTYI